MKIKIFLCILLIILVVSFISTVPAWAQEAKAYASILIIIPPAEEVEDKIEEESTDPKEQVVLVQADSDLAEEKE